MADDVDFAFELQSAAIAGGLSRISAAIPAGVAGECAECGEHMPRLVGGRCGFCRDGRLPPASFLDRVDPTPEAEEMIVMTTKVTPTSRTISLPVAGEVLAFIEARAVERDLPLGQAARSFVEEAMRFGTVVPAAEDVAIENLPDTVLVAELGRRLNFGASASDFEAEVARADAAEARLAQLREVLAG